MAPSFSSLLAVSLPASVICLLVVVPATYWFFRGADIAAGWAGTAGYLLACFFVLIFLVIAISNGQVPPAPLRLAYRIPVYRELDWFTRVARHSSLRISTDHDLRNQSIQCSQRQVSARMLVLMSALHHYQNHLRSRRHLISTLQKSRGPTKNCSRGNVECDFVSRSALWLLLQRC